jgi:hypothetical protein
MVAVAAAVGVAVVSRDPVGLDDGAVAAQPAIAIETSSAPAARRAATVDPKLRRFDNRPSLVIASALSLCAHRIARRGAITDDWSRLLDKAIPGANIS